VTSDSPDDSEIFSVQPQWLLDGVRAVASGNEIDDVARYLLSRCGLVKSGELTNAGLALFKLAWVLRNQKDAEAALGQALRQLTPLQVIEQELRGLGPVIEDGVLDLLRHHRAVPDDMTVAELRPMLRWFNGVHVLAYSTKLKSVRSFAPAPDAALAGEVGAIASMVSPRTPYLNVVKLRRILRPLRGTIWWADPHFHPRALEELAEEVDVEAVTGIRVLSGDADNVVSARSLADFRRFQAEMAGKNISSEWRIDSRRTRDWHDRWIADDKTIWNVPPINTLFKNDYSEILPGTERPPLETWWNRASPRI
jgi:hypothetical protein